MDLLINSELQKAALVIERMREPEMIASIKRAAELCIEAIRKGGKVMIAGNGGSAADAQHWAAELVARFNYDRPSIAALALTTDTSALTAIGNDYGYYHVFARQVEGLGKPEDVLIAISTSGNSDNVRNAVAVAKVKGIRTIGLTGNEGGKMKDECDLTIIIPSYETPHIQEGHAVFGHILCNLIETAIHPREFL